MFVVGIYQLLGEDGIIKGLDYFYMYCDLFFDNGKVYFIYGDLMFCNIMVFGDFGLCRVMVILDWEQVGWYLEYWEFCKMYFGVVEKDEWSIDDWLSKILEFDEDVYWVFLVFYEWWIGGIQNLVFFVWNFGLVISFGVIRYYRNYLELS